MRQSQTPTFRFLSMAFLALGVAFLPAAMTPPGDLLLKDSEHKKLGKALADWFEATSEKKDIAEAREELDKVVEKAQKKLKGQALLSSPADFGKALWYSKGYDRAKGIRKGKVAEGTATAGPYEANYAVSVPEKYSPKKVAYPLVICLGSPKTRPQDHLNEKWANAELRSSAILASPQLPEDEKLWCEMGSPDEPGGIAVLLLTLGDLVERYAVDHDRIFLAGHDEVLSAAVSLAAASPERFAGFIGRAGDIEGEIDAENFACLPTYFAGGGAGVTKFSEALAGLEYENSTLETEGDEDTIWAWMQNQVRNTAPDHVAFVPGTKRPLRVFWLEVPPTDATERPLIQGKVDRATNTITITGKQIASATVYFNDDLVDMDRPITVICNGVEHVNELPRNLTQAVNLQVRWGVDAGKVYVASNQYDLPALDD